MWILAEIAPPKAALIPPHLFPKWWMKGLEIRDEMVGVQTTTMYHAKAIPWAAYAGHVSTALGERNSCSMKPNERHKLRASSRAERHIFDAWLPFSTLFVADKLCFAGNL